jgi:2-oxoglutarate ferredoxin oxidoreductase subunit alpha
MVRLRQAKTDGIAAGVDPLVVDDPADASGRTADVLVLGWGSTYGPISAAVRDARGRGLRVAQAHLRHLNPLPRNVGEVLRAYRRVIVPEMNLGQLSLLLRARFLVDIQGYNQVRGMPFTTHELVDVISVAVTEQAGASARPVPALAQEEQS